MFPLSNAFGVKVFCGGVTQGALRDPGLWGVTPSAYALGAWPGPVEGCVTVPVV